MLDRTTPYKFDKIESHLKVQLSTNIWRASRRRKWFEIDWEYTHKELLKIPDKQMEDRMKINESKSTIKGRETGKTVPLDNMKRP